jgi:hypothetical protein
MSVKVGIASQDKHEALAYSINFKPDLQGALIASGPTSVVWTVSSELTVESFSNTTLVASIRVTGGVSGKTYPLECTVTGDDGSRHQGHIDLTITN